MSDWTPIEHLLDKALYSELQPAEQAQFDAFLAKHPAKRQEFDQMRATLALMDKRSLQEPNEDYWQHLTDAVVKRVGREATVAADAGRRDSLTKDSQPKAPHSKEFTVHPIGMAAQMRKRLASAQSWVFQLTAAAALLLVGFFAGRASESADGMQMAGNSNSYGFSLDRHSLPLIEASDDMPLQSRVRSYLERSSFLLMLNGSPELDHDALLSCGFDLDHQQEMSRELLVQTRSLQSELNAAKSPHGRAIGDLVADIEGYLVSISELSDPRDIHTLQPLHRQMDEIFCQVKCNLDELGQ